MDRSEAAASGQAYDLHAVDVLRERLDASYSEAREALEAAEGDVVSALAYLEEKRSQASPDLPQFLKELIDDVRTVVAIKEVKSANVALRGQPLFTIPLALCGVAAGVVVLASALLTNCRVEVTTGELEDGEV